MSGIDRAACETLDREDPLRRVRDEFDVDDGLIYLDGNSLGRPPRATAERVDRVVRSEWARALIRGWTDSGWLELPLRAAAAVAPLIGARAGEVVVGDSTSVCLFKLLAAAVAARPGRPVILTEEENFPTNLYIADGVARQRPRCRVRRVARTRLRDALDSDVAVLHLTHIDFRTGFMHDMHALTEAAHAAGALTVWDLSHSAGAVEVDLDGCGADLATGCGYKYLNGGPGAPAYIFVSNRIQAGLLNPIPGWIGHESPFDFGPDYRPAPGIRRWITGTPAVAATAALETAAGVLAAAGTPRLAEKSRRLTSLFIDLVDSHLGGGFEVASPRDASQRGAQVSLRRDGAEGIMRALAGHDVVGDFRPPDLCRFGFAPAYTRYVDVWDAVQRIELTLADAAPASMTRSTRR